MNTFLRIITLLGIIALFSFSSYKMNKAKCKADGRKVNVKDIIYYIVSIIVAISIMIFTFPTYIPLAWSKLILLFLALLFLYLSYIHEYVYKYVDGFDDDVRSGIVIVFILITIAGIVCTGVYPVTGKVQFEEPIITTKSYSIAITSDENNEVAVQKIIEANDEYYAFTYFDKSQNPVNVTTTADDSDIVVDASKENFATCKVEEKVFVYEHSEITDKGENLTFEDEVRYTVYVSENLYYDGTD